MTKGKTAGDHHQSAAAADEIDQTAAQQRADQQPEGQHGVDRRSLIGAQVQVLGQEQHRTGAGSDVVAVDDADRRAAGSDRQRQSAFRMCWCGAAVHGTYRFDGLTGENCVRWFR
jgi:hypothetical protein